MQRHSWARQQVASDARATRFQQHQREDEGDAEDVQQHPVHERQRLR
jgi:hypothetical protein